MFQKVTNAGNLFVIARRKLGSNDSGMTNSRRWFPTLCKVVPLSFYYQKSFKVLCERLMEEPGDIINIARGPLVYVIDNSELLTKRNVAFWVIRKIYSTRRVRAFSFFIYFLPH